MLTPELGFSWRNLLVQGEYYQFGVTQAKLPEVRAPRLGFNGGYVEGGWVFTGEPIPYDAERAAWGRPMVERPFSIGKGGIGAWELAARYSTVSLNSNVIPGCRKASPAGIWRPATNRGSGTQLIPERLASGSCCNFSM